MNLPPIKGYDTRGEQESRGEYWLFGYRILLEQIPDPVFAMLRHPELTEADLQSMFGAMAVQAAKEWLGDRRRDILNHIANSKTQWQHLPIKP